MTSPAVQLEFLAAAIAGSFTLALVGTRALVWYLGRRRVLDIPNERSSHSTPKPRGGGIAVMSAILLVWPAHALLADGGLDGGTIVVLGAAAVLAGVSFADDLITLSARLRLLVQFAAVVAGVAALPGAGGVFHGLLPTPLDLFLTGFLWLWFVNLYNFMDGIDGITGVETATVGIGLAGLAWLGLIGPAALGPALVVAAAALGFLVWNWAPSRIFIGDVGSVPMGYLLAWLLASAASHPEAGLGARLAIATIPMYYVADATITILGRMIRRENIFRAHRQHFYQMAVRRGLSHATVCRAILLANAGLVAVAWTVVPERPLLGIAAALAIVAALLLWLVRGRAPIVPGAAP